MYQYLFSVYAQNVFTWLGSLTGLLFLVCTCDLPLPETWMFVNLFLLLSVSLSHTIDPGNLPMSTYS